MYWSTKARGALAAHLARTPGCVSPSLVERSRNSGGLLGLGDHAAALASVARAPKDSFAESSGVFTASRVFAISEFCGSEILGDKQHGLMMYKLPKTSECFIPILVAP